MDRISWLKKWLKKEGFYERSFFLKMVIFLVLCIAGLQIFFHYSVGSAATKTFTTQELREGSSEFNEIDTSQPGEIKLQSGDIGQWNDHDKPIDSPSMSSISSHAHCSPDAVYGPNDTIYYLPAPYSGAFYKYEAELKKWTELEPLPQKPKRGSSLTYDGGYYIYGIPANDSSSFYRYDIRTDHWDKLTGLENTTFGFGADLSYSSQPSPSVFALRGGGSNQFLKYDIESDEWSEMASFPNDTSVGDGFGMFWDEGGSIYAITQDKRAEFRKYDISDDSWSGKLADNGIDYRVFEPIFVSSSRVMFVVSRYSYGSSFIEYDPTTDSWQDLDDPPGADSREGGVAGTFDGVNKLYTFLGPNTTRSLFEYNTDTDAWDTETSLFFSNWGYQHGDITYDEVSNDIYYVTDDWSASSLTQLVKKDLDTGDISYITNRWEWGYGSFRAEILYKDDVIYIVQGGSDGFFKYDLNSGDWTQLTDLPEGISYHSSEGSDLLDGEDGYLYFNTGDYDRSFYRYSIAGDSWENLSDISRPMDEGADLAIIPSESKVYAMVDGRGETNFLEEYDIAADSWTRLGALPVSNSNGSQMVSDGSRYLYMAITEESNIQTRHFYRYDTQNNEFKRMADTPSWSKQGARMFYDPNDSQVHFTPSHSLPYLWNWSATSDSYVSQGDWYSKKIDLTQVEDWNSLSATVSGSGNTTFYTRTSEDGNIFSDWQEVSAGSIQSPTDRYLQIKVSLSGDGTSTPVVSDLSVDYEQETTAPSQPSQFDSYESSSKEEEIISGETYEATHPYFEWRGASDEGGSGVAGYYVYFGTDSGADPETEGSWQTETSYEANLPMTAGEIYYLRIKVKDNLGNISSATTFFSYRYWYVSPPDSQLTTSQSDFQTGTSYNLDLTSDPGSFSLTQQSEGSWSHGWANPPPVNFWAGATAYVDGSIYGAMGDSSQNFYRFTAETASWEARTNVPVSVKSGSGLTYDGDRYLYLFVGGGNYDFYRYDTKNDSWLDLESTPLQQGRGTVLDYTKDGKILASFAGSSNFYSYDISSEAWSNLTAPPYHLRDNGGSGGYFDGDNTYYLNFGHLSNRERSAGFAKYNLERDNWTRLPLPPTSFNENYENLAKGYGDNLYVFGHNESNASQTYGLRYNISEERWYKVDSMYAVSYHGSLVGDGERFIYFFAPSSGASASARMLIYDSFKDEVLPQGYEPPTHGKNQSWNKRWYGGHATDMTSDGESIYLMAEDGTDRNLIAQYIVDEERYKHITPAPKTGHDAALHYSDGYLYLTGSYGKDLYRYDFNTQEWSSMTDAPGDIYQPGAGSLTSDDSGRLYVPKGGNNLAFYRFTPDASGGSWETLANVPSSASRSSLLYDGDDTIYMIKGSYDPDFYKYTISTDSFTTLADMPAGTGYSNGMSMNSGKIYVMRGEGTDQMFIYDIADDSWTTSGLSLPNSTTHGSAMTGFDSERAFMAPGDGVGYFWQFNYPGADRAHRGKGVYTSSVYDVEGIVDYANVNISAQIPENTDIDVYSRSSSDSSDWTDWQLSEVKHQFSDRITVRPACQAQRYTQIKVVLYSHDNVKTPAVDDINFSYYYDLDPPDNPTVLDAYSDETKTTTIESNDWNNFADAYFEWPQPGEEGGGTDGDLGSHIEGYYVYLGTDETADPVTAGTYTTDCHYQPHMEESDVYYLRIRTKDVAGNISTETFDPFTFKLDIDPPDNPPAITVTPSGFTAENNFTFEWPQASDSGGSGLAEYCYHTGATSGAYAEEQCQTELILENIEAAYKQGTNVFYLRSKDNAGNYGDGSTEVSYYYSTEPPSHVTNLQAIPTTSEENLFAFSWDLPSNFSGDSEQLTYYYSVNEKPGSHNTSSVDERYIAPFPAATKKDTNTIYVVAEDESGNIDWNNYASTDFVANTTAPGIPKNFSVSDVSDQDSGRWMIALSWDPPTFEGNGVDHYIIERSSDGHEFDQIATSGSNSFVDSTVQPENTYYYRVRASDEVGNFGGASASISIEPIGLYNSPPNIVSSLDINASFNQAEINWATERESTSFVHYGTGPNSLDASKGTLDLVSDHSVTITGLQPSTLYYVKAQSFDQDRNYSVDEALSQVYSFMTEPAASITNVKITDVTLNSAVVSWQTSVPTKSSIEYGTSSSYGMYEKDDNLTSKHLMKLENLDHSSPYYFKIVSTTEVGDNITSDEYSFSTLSYPQISNISFQPIKDAPTTSVRVSWQTNVPTTSIVQYRLASVNKEVSKSKMTKSHQIELDQLSDNSDYVMTIKGRDQHGNLVSSDPQTWHSEIDTREPKIMNLMIEPSLVGGAGGKEGQFIVSWQTDEPATSQVEYGEGSEGEFTQSTLQDSNLSTEHVTVLSGLKLSQIYHLRPVSRDNAGNTAYGEATLATTNRSERTVLDIILDIFERIIGSLKEPLSTKIFYGLSN